MDILCRPRALLVMTMCGYCESEIQPLGNGKVTSESVEQS